MAGANKTARSLILQTWGGNYGSDFNFTKQICSGVRWIVPFRRVCFCIGEKALCLITDSGLKRNQAVLDKSFEGSGVSVDYEAFNRECCKKEIDRIGAVCKEKGIDVVIGVGGGKTFDTIKAVGYYHDLPVVIVPTIASTDAPCSACLLYTSPSPRD